MKTKLLLSAFLLFSFLGHSQLYFSSVTSGNIGTTTASFTASYINCSGTANVILNVSTNSSFSNIVVNLPFNNVTSPGSTTASATGLVPNTTYYFRFYGDGNAPCNQSTSFSTIQTFTTLGPPVVTTPTISGISSQLVTASSTSIVYALNANNAATTSVINYGLSSGALTNQIAGFSASGTTAVSNSVALLGLVTNTIYYYQIVATNSSGTTSSAIGSFTAGVQAVIPVIAEYNFNNTLNNMVGSAPFSTNTSLSYVADRNSTALSALRINGTGTSATIANLPTGTAPRTVSIWYKVNTTSNDNCLFVYGQSGGQNAYGVSFNNADVWFNFAWNTNTPFANPSNDGAWHHLVTTFDASKTSKVYLDGALKNTVVQNGWDTSANNNTFWLGGLFSSTTSTFNGTVDDLTIYNFALTDNQVLNLFNSPTLSSQDFNHNNLEVSLYPNPANDVLNIEMTNELKSIEIYNIQGQKILHATQKQMNVSQLASGMYMIRIQDTKNAIATKKFMKK